MPGVEYDLNPVSRITTGAIGPPGQRVFYLQGQDAATRVTLVVEKIQIQSLAAGLEQFLQELSQQFPDLPEASAEFQESEMELELPVDPAFRVGQLGLGFDRDSDRVIVVAHELVPEGQDPDQAAVARFWCTRSQLRVLGRWGVELAGRGRPICGNCGEPIDPRGHFCPRSNGHKH
ncbi:MAG TPA: DUF3090 domain-containing protein [Anaerolineales bacterium]|nr:DUF3090 domain-containing protein [Anaerolineales bacterium]